MIDFATREHGALDVLDQLPEGWHVGRISWNPCTRRWAITARGPHPDRGRAPETISGIGPDEPSAVTNLRIRLAKRHRPDQLAEIERRGRAAFLEAAEAQSQATEGRPLTADELEQVTRRYPER